MKILLAQINPKIGDLDNNTRKIIETIEHGKKQGADAVLFPELTLCGYPPEDLVYHASFLESMTQHLSRIILASKGIAVFVGLVRKNHHKGEKSLLNSAAVIYDTNLLGFQDKWLLPTYDVFNERRYFEPGTKTKVWEINNKRIGVVICEDIWQHAGYVGDTTYTRDPIQELAGKDLDLLVNLSASPYQFQKPHIRTKVCGKAAKTLKCPVILCCQVGANDQIIFDGYSVHVDKEGHLRTIAKGFEEDLVLIDLEGTPKPRPFDYKPRATLFSALKMGVRDYFHKQGFYKACFGLSGGIDSALVACIAKEALGPENVLGVCMPSRYSSEGSVKDSEKLAKNLGINYQLIEIESVFEEYLKLLKPTFKGYKEDVTEENIQARIRGMILMAISNKLGHIVLSTGNKSEIALGYCTLYGDMVGGLGVIADVIKTKVYELVRWYNKVNKKEVVPNDIIIKPPSAELRPNQIDLDTLPDYQVIDNVLQGYVEDYLSTNEIAEKYSLSVDIVTNLIRKIHRAEYKRRQGALNLRVTKKSFGIGRHYPIVQGWR